MSNPDLKFEVLKDKMKLLKGQRYKFYKYDGSIFYATFLTYIPVDAYNDGLQVNLDKTILINADGTKKLPSLNWESGSRQVAFEFIDKVTQPKSKPDLKLESQKNKMELLTGQRYKFYEVDGPMYRATFLTYIPADDYNGTEMLNLEKTILLNADGTEKIPALQRETGERKVPTELIKYVTQNKIGPHDTKNLINEYLGGKKKSKRKRSKSKSKTRKVKKGKGKTFKKKQRKTKRKGKMYE